MTVLAGAVGVSDNQIITNIAVTTGSYPAPFTLGSEAVLVTGGSGSRVLVVERGQNGTAPATHAIGVTVTTGWYSGGGAPEAHAASHQNGGTDEIDVTGLQGAGGVTNGAPNHALAVSDGTNLVGSTSLTWDGISVLGLDARENGHALVKAIGIGAELSIEAADGDASHPGGEIGIVSGGSQGGDGGDIAITTGDDTGGGDSGSLNIATGAAHINLTSEGGSSGQIAIRTGTGDWQGGDINIVAGNGLGSDGGSVVIQAGAKTTGGSHGSVQLYAGNGNTSLELGNAGFYVTGDVTIDGKIGFYGTTPIAKQTGVAVNAGAIHAALVALGLIEA